MTQNLPALRQEIRRELLIFSSVLLPVTFAYISCPIITEGASQGIATGDLLVFTLLFFGRFWCGHRCPAGGHKIFRDEIWGGMRATSLIMNIPAVRREVVKNMPTYMIQPLQRSIETSTVLAKRRAKE